MLSGEVPFAYGPSVPVINASLRGSDLVLIGNTGNALVFSIMSRPEIKQPAQLKGKKVGVTRLGGSTDWALDAALKQWNLERGRDLIVIQTGGMPEGLAALIAGALDAVVLSPPSNFQRGERPACTSWSMSASWALFFRIRRCRRRETFIKSNRDTTLRFLRGFTQGLAPVAHGQRIQHEGAVEIYQGDGHRDAGATASNLRRALQRRSHSLRPCRGCRRNSQADSRQRSARSESRRVYRQQPVERTGTERLVSYSWDAETCASSSLAGRVGLGQFVVRELFTHGHQVAALDTTKPRECPCPTYTADLGKRIPFQDRFKNVDAVVHLARQRFPYTETGFNTVAQRWEFPDTVGDAERFNLNVAMTNNVLAAARVAGVRKIVCGSSLAVYGLYYPVTALQPGLSAGRRRSSATAAGSLRTFQARR